MHQRVQIKSNSQIPGDDHRPGLGSQGGGNNIDNQARELTLWRQHSIVFGQGLYHLVALNQSELTAKITIAASSGNYYSCHHACLQGFREIPASLCPWSGPGMSD